MQIWGFVFPIFHRKAEIASVYISFSEEHKHMHMCRHTEKYTILILTLLTLFGTAHQCHINVLISCVFPKVLKNVIFPDRDGIRKIHTHDHGQAFHLERTEIPNCTVQDTQQQDIKEVLFKAPKLLYYGKWKTSSFLILEANLTKGVAASENMQLLWGRSIKDCWQ